MRNRRRGQPEDERDSEKVRYTVAKLQDWHEPTKEHCTLAEKADDKKQYGSSGHDCQNRCILAQQSVNQQQEDVARKNRKTRTNAFGSRDSSNAE